MNWADLCFVFTPLICALSAGAGAAQMKMGWASWLFALGGFVLGLGFGCLTRGLGLLLLFAVGNRSRPVATAFLLLAYLLVPMAVMFGAFLSTTWLSLWIARHLA